MTDSPDRSFLRAELTHVSADLARLHRGRLVLMPEEVEWVVRLEARAAELESELGEECREERE